MSAEKFNKLISYELISVDVQTVEIPYNGLSELKEADTLNNEMGISTMSFPNQFKEDNLFAGGGGGSPTTQKTYTASYVKATLKTTTSYVKAGEGYNIFVKQVVDTGAYMYERYSDILGIGYTDNIRLAFVDVYPDIEFTLSYNIDYHLSSEEEERTIKYNGKDIGQYSYGQGDHIAFRFDLPSDASRYKCSNIVATAEYTFQTNIAGLLGTELKSIYMHQTGDGHFDWGNLSFSLTPPYVSYSTSFWVDDPSYDDPLYSAIGITFE